MEPSVPAAEVVVTGSVEVAAVMLMREVMALPTVTKSLRSKESVFALYAECLTAVRSPAPAGQGS